MHFLRKIWLNISEALRGTKFEELFYFQMNLQVLKAEK